MLLNKKNLAIAALASKENSRYTLQGIHVSKNGTAVTDGHIAVRVSAPNAEVKNFPVIDGLNDLKQPDFILPTDAALKIANAIPKEKTLEILNHAQVGELASGKLAIGVTDLDNAQTFQPKKMEGQFPDVKTVFANVERKTGMTIMADANLLVDVLRQLIAFNGKDVSYTGGKLVAFTFYDNASAFRIQTSCDETGQTFDAIQMPCHFPDGWNHSPVKPVTPAATPVGCKDCDAGVAHQCEVNPKSAA